MAAKRNTRQNRGASRSVSNTRSNHVLGGVAKMGRAFAWSIIFLAVAYSATWVAPRLNPAIDQVVVVGEFQYLNENQLRQVIFDNLDAGILQMNIAQLGEHILDVPWVERVEIVKQFPSTLVVTIFEEQAIARWNDQGYISHLGKFIYSEMHEELVALPHLSSDISGLNVELGAERAIELYHLLNSAVLVSGENIAALQQSRAGGWSMVWDMGLSINLGRSDHLNRTRHVLTAWQRLPMAVKSNIDRIDARYDNGVTVHQRQQIGLSQIFNKEHSAMIGADKRDNPA